jgi:AcrR family transcriptional regulator
MSDRDPRDTALRHAADQLFQERGYAGTRVADIAERAGVAAASFYRHFSSKTEAFETITGSSPPEHDAAAPATARGRRTRRALLDAARAIFEADGFGQARVGDIAQRAGTSVGTFYTYFGSKDDALHALARETGEVLIERSRPLADYSAADPVAQIRETIRLYLESYARHGRLLTVFARAAAVDEVVADLERQTWLGFVRRASRGIQALQADGLADPYLDAQTAAAALAAMVGQFAYIWLSAGEDYDPGVALDTLTRLWAQGIGLNVPPKDEPLAPAARAR